MKNFLKKPEHWGEKATAKTAKTETPVEPNRARIEAKMAEIKASIEKLKK